MKLLLQPPNLDVPLIFIYTSIISSQKYSLAVWSSHSNAWGTKLHLWGTGGHYAKKL